MVSLKKLAVQITEREEGAAQVNIAQTQEILGHLGSIMREAGPEGAMEIASALVCKAGKRAKKDCGPKASKKAATSKAAPKKRSKKRS